MNAMQLEHPNGALLTAYGLGQLSEEELAGIDGHLANCAVCRQVVEGVAPDTLLTLLRSAATEPDSAEWMAAAEPGGEVAGPVEAGSTAAPAVVPPALTNHPRYRVGALLGIGGMGAVYQAEHLLMERPVALKVLNRELIDKPATIERFRREVRAAARLTHPNIVAAFDAEQAGDVHFLVMEYVEGVSLARRVTELGPLPVAEACDYVRQAALGLQHAHERGMVHRDIKPQNLMLTPGGQVKILDFGLARFVMESVPAGAMLAAAGAPAAPQSEAGPAKPLTQTGIVMGTPDYIAPEQARDSHLADIRADMYSLGCTLYDLLAGHAPFPEGNAVQKVKAHLAQTPKPLKDLRHDVPPELVKIVERMMAKDPEERFQTPVEVAAALTPFLAAAPKPPRRKKWPALAAGVAFVAALVAGLIIYVQTDNGRIIIEANDDTIAVMIQKAGGVKIVEQANKREYRLRPGEQDVPRGDYKIEVIEALAGLDFQVKQFELKRGKEVRLSAKYVANVDGKILDTPLTATERKRATDRLNALKEIVALQEAMHHSGRVSVDLVLEAKREVAKAELDLCESDKERVKIRERIVALAQDLVKFREAQLQAGNILGVDVLKAKADLLQALTDLDRAKAKTTPRDSVLPKQASGQQGPLFGGKPASFWLEQLKDANPKFRAEAVGALGMIALENKELIPVLVAALKDKAQGVGLKASNALGSLGPDSVPALLEVLNDKKSPIALRRAAIAVGRIGPEAKAAVSPLSQALKIEDWDVRLSAIYALGRIGPHAKTALPAMIDVYGSYLAEIDKGPNDPIENLEFDRNDNTFPQFVYEALLKIDPLFSDSIRRELPGVSLQNRYSRSDWPKFHDWLKKRYPTQKAALPSDRQPKETTEGDASRSKLDKKEQGPLFAGKPASFWLDQLQDTNPRFRAEAVEALGSIAQKNKELVPVLVDSLKDKDDGVGRKASEVLGALGPKIVPLLLEVLKDKTSPSALRHAADAVGMIGPDAKAAVPYLAEALIVDKGTVRRSAITALGLIGPDAKPALPAMVDVLGEYLKTLELPKPDQKTHFERRFPQGENRLTV
jgi:HEAT repeat protein/tRNA A-37 threonylcarbamoyl transferase component Bud32